jgi:predicted HicB family RNase H-like nuclease
VHREAAIAAAQEGKSLNAWLAEIVAQAAHHAVQASESTNMDG